MSSERKSIRFGDLLTSEGTRNGIYKSKEFHGRGAKIVNMGELFAYPRLFDVEMKRVDIDSGEEEKFSLKAGDLLFARRSLVAEGAGKCSIVKEVEGATIFESSIIRARVDTTKADSEYLYYTFSSVVGRNLLGTILRQTSVSGITGTDLVELEIPLPPVAEQKAIAHILGTLDDKIELNRKTNETLEAMAKALFKSWFVDFDPVRAKAEDRPTRLPVEISNLFPDSFEDSELGEIPSGWEGVSFGNFTTAKRGKMITRKDTIDGNIPVVAGGMEPAYYHNQSNVDSPVVTISASGANAGFVNLYLESIWASDCSYISQTESKFPFTCYLFLISSQKRIYDAQHGGVQPHINPGDLGRLSFINAKEKIFEVFEDVIRPVFARISNATEQSKRLASLRDALLPKLISGELRIPDAERMLEVVGV